MPTFRIGQGLDDDFGASHLRPGLSDEDADVQTGLFAWYVFGDVDGQAVAFDLLLQGGPFRSGPHVDLVWDVGEEQAGFAALAHGMRFSFTYAAQTQEFQGQHGGLHRFGSAALSAKFYRGLLQAISNMIATKGGVMNVAYLSALSALAGSALGGMASIVTSWLNQHSQDRSQRHAQSIARRERLYGDFVDEASALVVDALIHDQMDPSKFVQIYATVGKLRLFASCDVVSKAEKVMRDVREIYYLPKRDYANRDTALNGELNLLQAFSEACRDDLRN
jgi:Uncharacterized protein conserved in bacteria (DUF2219)